MAAIDPHFSQARAEGWPLRLIRQDLSTLLDTLNMPVNAMSPLNAMLREPASSPVSSDLTNCAPTEEVKRALRALCAPRQLVLVRRRPHDSTTPALEFFNDGEAVVQIAFEEAGCTFSQPYTHAEFGALICCLAGVDTLSSLEEPLLVNDKFLDSIVRLRSAGLFASTDATLDAHELRSALAEPAEGDYLNELAIAGVLTINESVVSPDTEWLRRHRYLSVPAALKIEALELDDIAAGRRRRKGLAMLGSEPERVVLLPACVGEIDTILELQAASITSVIQTVGQLLAPPLSPPYYPTVRRTPNLGDALEVTRENLDTGLPGWQEQPLEALITPAHRKGVELPAALLNPQATIQVSSIDVTGIDATHTVFALDGNTAAAWTLKGSLVRWRTLGPGQVLTQVIELIPAGVVDNPGIAADAGCMVCELSLDALGVLAAASSDFAESPAIPAPLRALASDTRMRWYTIRVTCKAEEGNLEHMILLAEPDTGSAWRFELTGSRVRASIADAAVIRSELASVLAASTKTARSSWRR
jgi:hypothetical protein